MARIIPNLVAAESQTLERAYRRATRSNRSFEKDVSYVSSEIRKNHKRAHEFKNVDLQATKVYLTGSWVSYQADIERLTEKMDRLVAKIDRRINAEDHDPQLTNFRTTTLQVKDSLQRGVSLKGRRVERLEQRIDSLMPR